MHTGLLHMHSLLRWILLVLLILTIVKLFAAKKSDQPFSDGLRKLGLFTLISAHLQLVIGLVLYLGTSEIVQVALSDMGAAMKATALRFWAVEHIFGMVLAIVLITVGYSKSKRAADDALKNKKMRTFFLIALILILATIPWPFREAFAARGWF